MNGFEAVSITALLCAIGMLCYQIVPWAWLDPRNRKEGFIWGVDPGRSSGVATLPEIDKMIDARVEEIVDAKASQVRKEFPHLFDPTPTRPPGHAELTDARGQVHQLETEEVELSDGTIRYVFKPLCTQPRIPMQLIDPSRPGAYLEYRTAKRKDPEFEQGH